MIISFQRNLNALRVYCIALLLMTGVMTCDLLAAPHHHVFNIQVTTQNTEYSVDERTRHNTIRLNAQQRMRIESTFSPSNHLGSDGIATPGSDALSSYRIFIEGDELEGTIERSPLSGHQLSPAEIDPSTISQTHYETIQGNSHVNATTHAGGGKATQYFARGFDLDHGTDLAMDINGIPINMLSHAHGQGYTDLSFIIPELVTVSEHLGPYWSQFGDMATAGQLSFHTLSARFPAMFNYTVGPNQLQRFLIMRSFQIGDLNPSIAAEFYSSNGFTDLVEDYKRFNFVADIPIINTPSLSWKWMIMSHIGAWNAGGQIPQRAVSNGSISRFGFIDSTDGGDSYRHSVSSHLTFKGVNDNTVSLLLYGMTYGLNLFSNFSFFQNDPVNGDQIGQYDSRVVFGGKLQREEQISFLDRTITQRFGVDLRHDKISNRLDSTVERQSTSKTVDALIDETHLGIFSEHQLSLTEKLDVALGLRIDAAHYSVTDRLDALSPTDNSGSGSAFSMMLSPKLRVNYALSDHVNVFGRAGVGFHSNDARGVVLPPQAAATPLTQARGIEGGITYTPNSETQLTATVWRLDLDNELAWVGDEGVTELKGPSRRIGLDVSLHTTLSSHLSWNINGSLSRSELKDLPSGENYIPLSPSVVINSNLNVNVDEKTTVALESRYFGDRAGNEDNSVSLGGYLVHHASINHVIQDGVRVFGRIDNLFDSPWRQAQFYYSSQLQGESVAIDDSHFVPGQPRQISVGVSLSLD